MNVVDKGVRTVSKKTLQLNYEIIKIKRTRNLIQV